MLWAVDWGKASLDQLMMKRNQLEVRLPLTLEDCLLYRVVTEELLKRITGEKNAESNE